jgi:hypothetical protein
MNDSTEQQMKEWRLRQPSPGLRSRIFASEAAAGAPSFFAGLPRQSFDWAALTRWLVPAVGCFIMVTATLTDPDMPTPNGSGDVFAEHRAKDLFAWHNNAPAATLEWTFARPFSSSNDPFVRTETNTLIK